jgi:hypothetical protein
LRPNRSMDEKRRKGKSVRTRDREKRNRTEPRINLVDPLKRATTANYVIRLEARPNP